MRIGAIAPIFLQSWKSDRSYSIAGLGRAIACCSDRCKITLRAIALLVEWMLLTLEDRTA
ncbi:hypothetical protein H6F77_21215 [Microcoleus sp. FACHB-831]|uniref:hypothetical protein n=1 Tax=Microcoleus sp. FACHB-831 TaxID=2692827 RepID=UPI0016857066|nr:hypothetical protein [Microcoleus sp. FACHB-831]MBD1923572.1 hypothetical protein [Microcoleus sp. FACHB-831]